MIPYERYLNCLHLIHKSDEKKIIEELKGLGLPSNQTLIDYSVDNFFRMIGKYSETLSSCLYVEFSDSSFKEILLMLELEIFFDEREIKKELFKIVSDPLIKKHVECCLITNVEFEKIVSDVSKLYRVDITIDDIISFRSLFFDISKISNTNNFVKYADNLPPEERVLKNKCRAGGPQYTRWALGADVDLDSKRITKDMLADVFFRYKEKASQPSKDSFDEAMKLGSLATKLVDRDMKMEEKFSDGEIEDVAQQLCLFDMEDDDPKLAGDINKDEK